MDFKGDIHTFGVSMPGQDNLLKKDVVAGQEMMGLDSKVSGGVDKKEGDFSIRCHKCGLYFLLNLCTILKP